MCPHPNINPDPTSGFLADVQPAYATSNPNDNLYAAQPGEDMVTKMMSDILSLATETTSLVQSFKD